MNERPTSGSLSPWRNSAAWTSADAAHLLRRAGFGAAAAETRAAHAAGLNATIERLVRPHPETEEFQFAETALRRSAAASADIKQLKAWWIYRMRHSANPLVEKMTLFWHNHFATSDAKVKSTAAMGAQNDLLRRLALGSFRELLHAIARDPAMLLWLDGNDNRKRAANENFAREVLELFSLGIGNYTEKDVQQAARAFTGWHVRDDAFWMETNQHDDGVKTVFRRSGPFDGDEVLDLCLDHPACPRFLAGKLLQTFVSPNPTKQDFDAVAALIVKRRFQMGDVLRELFGSELFFSERARDCIIKGPLDFVVGTFRTLDVSPNLEPTLRLLTMLGQDVFEPPTVKGWEGNRLWINAATLLHRTQFAADLLSGEKFGRTPNLLALLDADGRATDERLVERLATLLLGRPAAPEVCGRLSNFVRRTAGSQEERLRGAAYLTLTMPEYQLL